MKYYLETNALRALGKAINKKSEILKYSYTSMFSLFEIYRGIDRKSPASEESQKRSAILSNLSESDLQFLQYMPNEMIQLGFTGEVVLCDSMVMQYALKLQRMESELDEELLDALIKSYEDCKIAFNEIIRRTYNVRPPEKEIVQITNLDDYIIPFNEGKQISQSRMAHPSHHVMDILKDDASIDLFRAHNKTSSKSNGDIVESYKGTHDIFFFVLFGYNLMKSAKGGMAKRNDLYDLFHTLYLYDREQIMVTNDTLLQELLPSINVMTVEDFRKLM
ncbi:hypothetical protein J2847_006803 [Azospirillum agricola]|uniref:hypothetical protein n=1 Tax=Azospirillum agricola TaxID=1720247 RepID=UPI001AEAD485|nr:hypothetical protein [Azospirillum agricola]MBP2233465.1 hypothetical protein [Azospirillum agricola]